MKVLLIDNYDSFTFNIYQYIGELLQRKEQNFTLDVFRNDQITIADIKKNNYDRIIISPGPGDPSSQTYFGICKEIITKIDKSIPVLGVCLGMQGIAYYSGGKIANAKKLMHGKISIISHDGKGIFKTLPQNLEAMRYHSLIVSDKNFPSTFEISAVAKGTGEIMGIRHKTLPLEGVQFHPESFATEAGKQMLENFLFQTYEK
jgi:anthranilate synthase/aminodeoxychorismate synthase-like glutamine amidotransferase